MSQGTKRPHVDDGAAPLAAKRPRLTERACWVVRVEHYRDEMPYAATRTDMLGVFFTEEAGKVRRREWEKNEVLDYLDGHSDARYADAAAESGWSDAKIEADFHKLRERVGMSPLLRPKWIVWVEKSTAYED